MNKRILLLAAVAVGLSSCSTMYKSGQTPDDVYYSPAPQQRVAYSNDDEYYDDNDGQGEYVNVQTEQDRSAYSSEDNYLRMKVRNRSLWSSLDYGYYGGGMYSPYSYGSRFGMGFGYNPYSFYSPFASSYYGMGMGMGFGWGGLYNGFYDPYSFYNPYYPSYGYGHYYPGLISTKPGNVRPAGTYAPRRANLGSYGNRNTNPELNNGRNAPVRVFRNNDNNYINPRNSSSGNTTSPRRSADRSSDSRPTRTFERSNSTPSAPRVAPSSNSGSRSSGGGSAPSRSPGRGGR